MADKPQVPEITPFNPLAPEHLGESVSRALLAQPCYPLADIPVFRGAGAYAIYYCGDSPYYRPIAEQNRDGCKAPIYVGKAVPPGSRKGIAVGEAGFALYSRLKQHAQSIRQVWNPGTPGHLDIAHFRCRFLVVDDVWIPLIESLSITSFKPPRNGCIDGFGHHDQGSTRRNQQRSLWDTLHPGRPWAAHYRPNEMSSEEIAELLNQYFSDPTARPQARRKRCTTNGKEGIAHPTST